MAFQVSPGVQVSEVDLTNIVPAVSSVTGAFAGQFQWGPVDEVVTVSDAKGLVENFHSPIDSLAGAEDFYSAESFLKYGSSLRVVRLIPTGLYTAVSGSDTDAIIKNEDDYELNYSDGGSSSDLGTFAAKYPGAMGNSLKVSVCASSNAFKNSDVTQVNDATANSGDTLVTVDDGTVFSVRDQIQFAGHSQFYRITAISTNDLTIEAIGKPSGSGLQEDVADDAQVTRYWEFHDQFDRAPGTSASATLNGGSADEIHVVVVDEDGQWSGIKNSVLEKYSFVSCATDGKDGNGESNYYKDVINRSSGYIWWTGHSTSTHAAANSSTTHSDSASSNFGRPSAPINVSLTNGANGSSVSAAIKYQAYVDHFGDAEKIDLSFLIVGSTRTASDNVTDHNSIVNQLIAIAEGRKDCMVIASPRRTSVVNVASENDQLTNVLADFANVSSSSYAVLDSGWLYYYDRFHDKYVWIPGSGHTAGIMARSDLLRDPWYSPAGFARGQYLGVSKIAFNPKQASRDDLYRARINPIVTFPGQGTVLFGDKTALSTPSAFDRINVRRLFIVLEKAIATAAKAQLFEFNDEFTRAQFRAAVEPFLRDVKNRRGLVDFSVVCDGSNNTDSVIDRNEFVCSIFVKPARSINFITLNFVAARSGVEFEEIYGAV